MRGRRGKKPTPGNVNKAVECVSGVGSEGVMEAGRKEQVEGGKGSKTTLGTSKAPRKPRPIFWVGEELSSPANFTQN